MDDLVHEALAIEGIKSASFDGSKGVVYDSVTGIEYDVRTAWNVNDDEGRNFVGRTLAEAIASARAANL